MKILSQVSLIALAAISFVCNASPVEPSFACKSMLERGSEMFCAKDADVAFQDALAEAAPLGKGSFACETMTQRGSEMFCAKEDGAAYEQFAAVDALILSQGSYACDTMIQRGSEMFCAKEQGFAITHVEDD